MSKLKPMRLTKTKKPYGPDKEALKFAGWRGHTYVVITSKHDGETSERTVTFETCSLDGAQKMVETELKGRGAVIYNQIARGVWEKVS